MEKDQTYINDLLRQYRDGSISVTDRHRLERMALDDSFLFDSLEGYASANVPDSRIATERIKSHVPRSSERVINMKFISIAAGVVILIGGLLWVNDQFDSRNQETISSVVEKEVEAKDEVVDQEGIESMTNTNQAGETEEADFIGTKVGDLGGNSIPSELLDDSEERSNVESNAKPPSRENISTTSTVSVMENASVPIANSNVEEVDQVILRAAETPIEVASSTQTVEPEFADVTIEKEKDLVSNNTSTVRSAPNGNKSPAASARAKKKQESTAAKVDPFGVDRSTNKDTFGTPQSDIKTTDVGVGALGVRTITGVLRDNTGEPLIGANVISSNSGFGVSTDIDGSFSIEVDSAINKLQIVYVGFSDLVVELDTSSTYDLMLDEDAATLDEVIVTGYASNVNDPQPSYVLPPKGRAAYKDVVKSKASTGCAISGKVRLKFTVTKHGEVTDFEVKKGLTEECNQRAIQIIRDSGTWNNQFNKDKKVKYTISF